MKRVIKVIIVVVFCTTVLTSCMPENMEISERLIIEAIGIDWEDEKYKVAIQVLDTSNAGEGSSKSQNGGESSDKQYTRVYETEGETLSLAIQESTLVAGKRPLYSHNRVLVIGSEAADKKLMDIVDFMVRSYEMRYTISVAIYQGKAAEVIKANNGSSIPAETIETALESGKINAGVPYVEILEIARSLYDEKSGQYMPAVVLQDGDKEKIKDIKVEGAAILGNYRLKTFLNESETRGLVWINDKLEDGIFETQIENEGAVSLKVVSSKTKISVKIVDGVPHYIIRVKCECDIGEMPWEYSDNFEEEKLNVIKNVAKEEIEKDINASIQKCIYKYNCDVFGLIQRLWKSEPEYFRQWSSDKQTYDLSTMTFEIEANVKIRRIIQNIVRSDEAL